MKNAVPGRQRALLALSTILVGISLSVTLGMQFLGYEAYAPTGRVFVIIVPAAAFAFLLHQALDRSSWMPGAFSGSAALAVAVLAATAGTTLCLTLGNQALILTAANCISAAAVAWLLMSPVTRFLRRLIAARQHLRLAGAWLTSSAAAFMVVGFLANFYRSSLEIFALTILLDLVLGLAAFHALGRSHRLARRSRADAWISLALLLLPAVWVCLLFWIGSQYPAVFHGDLVLLERTQTTPFLLASLVSFPWLAWLLVVSRSNRSVQGLRRTAIFRFVDENLPGLLLAAQFMLVYFLVGSVLNQERFDVDDIFFDADAFIWRYRLTTEHWQDFYWRSVHPLALLVLRPPVGLLAMLLRGDRPMSASLLAAATGAAGVFLAWMFARRALRSTPAALIIAALLGFSASHLVFGSMIETYALLAAASLLFFVLFQRGTHSLTALVPVGLLSAGITLTHLAQTAVVLLTIRRDPRLLAKYVLLVSALLIPLSLASELVYPNAAPLFFLPSGFSAEEENVWPLSSQRLEAMVRSFAFYAIAAPEPIVSSGEIPFSQFRFFRAESGHLSEYETPLQTATAWSWMILLFIGGISFASSLRTEHLRILLALLICLAFNGLLLLRYGKEFFLYSGNWTFALVLFLGLAWKPLFRRRWFQVALVAFLLMLMLNNLGLLQTVMRESALYFG
jgi:hypothetical protein